MIQYKKAQSRQLRHYESHLERFHESLRVPMLESPARAAELRSKKGLTSNDGDDIALAAMAATAARAAAAASRASAVGINVAAVVGIAACSDLFGDGEEAADVAAAGADVFDLSVFA